MYINIVNIFIKNKSLQLWGGSASGDTFLCIHDGICGLPVWVVWWQNNAWDEPSKRYRMEYLSSPPCSNNKFKSPRQKKLYNIDNKYIISGNTFVRSLCAQLYSCEASVENHQLCRKRDFFLVLEHTSKICTRALRGKQQKRYIAIFRILMGDSLAKKHSEHMHNFFLCSSVSNQKEKESEPLRNKNISSHLSYITCA